MSFPSVVWRILPLLVVFLGFGLVQFDSLNTVNVDILRAVPYVLAAVLLAFASMFNRYRFIAPILVILFVYVFIRERLQSPLTQENVMAMFVGLNVLFCMQLSLIAILPEKGMFNRVGMAFLSVLLVGSVLLWFYGDSPWWINWLALLELQQVTLSENNYWATQALLVCHLATLMILIMASLIRKSVSDFALIITWVSGVLVFYEFGQPEISSVLFSAVLLALFMVFQQSNYRVTYMDALTGIPGRRALEDYLSTLGRSYCIAMLDVDHFKKFNDTYGHDVGDQVLRMVASKINLVEGGGKAFRYGGEEFTIVFNRRNADQSFVFLEAIRESIQQYQMTLRSDDRVEDRTEGKKQRGGKKVKSNAKKVSVTISIGVANSQAGFAPIDVIKAADDKLYKAKEAGRNCTIR